MTVPVNLDGKGIKVQRNIIILYAWLPAFLIFAAPQSPDLRILVEDVSRNRVYLNGMPNSLGNIAVLYELRGDAGIHKA